jgi:hypothetical protein
MSGWTVITARLNIGWSVSKIIHPIVKLSANPPPAGFETLAGSTCANLPGGSHANLGTFFYVDRAMQCSAMQCNATKEPPTTSQLLANLITLCIREQILPF